MHGPHGVRAREAGKYSNLQPCSTPHDLPQPGVCPGQGTFQYPRYPLYALCGLMRGSPNRGGRPPAIGAEGVFGGRDSDPPVPVAQDLRVSGFSCKTAVGPQNTRDFGVELTAMEASHEDQS